MEKINHSEICARYIYDQDVQFIDYSDHIDRGKDPREHILWNAASVLGLIEREGFQAELECWNDKQSIKKRKRGSWSIS